MSFLSYAEQYYDPVTRRYIESGPTTPRRPIAQRLPANQILLPTQQEIEAERQRIEQQRMLEQQKATPSPSTMARRKFDPNRYHNTEEIIISP